VQQEQKPTIILHLTTNTTYKRAVWFRNLSKQNLLRTYSLLSFMILTKTLLSTKLPNLPLVQVLFCSL